MGAVYRAWDLRLEIPVALKEMAPQPGLNYEALQNLRAQFHQEAALVAKFDHPNLVNVSDFFEEYQNAYLIMSFVKGENLHEYITRMGALSEGQVLKWATQLLGALIYIHDQGIIHRDIKPQNVILHLDGQVVLVDFGLVKLWNPNDPRTQTIIRSMGTPGYAPPEQYDPSRGHTDPRSDLYSLAATLYHAVTGNIPPTVTERVVNPGSLRPIRQLNPDISPHVEATLLRALSLQPQDRFQSAAAMLDALQQPAPSQTEGYVPLVPTPEITKASPPVQRHKLPWIWVLTIVTVLILCLLVFGGSAFHFLFRPRLAATAPPTSTSAAMVTTNPLPITAGTVTRSVPSPTKNSVAVRVTSTPAASMSSPAPPTSTPLYPTTTSLPACPSVVGTFANVWRRHQSQLGCARSNVYSTWTAREYFEGGQMLWREDTDNIWVLYQNGTWQAHSNTWREGDPTYSCPQSAPSQSPPTPIRGFGKVWCTQPDIRSRLGDATNVERGFDSLVQDFELGSLIRTDEGTTYILYVNRRWSH
jgi:serine/threonine-protein kinase